MVFDQYCHKSPRILEIFYKILVCLQLRAQKMSQIFFSSLVVVILLGSSWTKYNDAPGSNCNTLLLEYICIKKLLEVHVVYSQLLQSWSENSKESRRDQFSPVCVCHFVKQKSIYLYTLSFSKLGRYSLKKLIDFLTESLIFQ